MNALDRTSITLKKLNAIYVNVSRPTSADICGKEFAGTFQANVMRLGYVLDREAFNAVSEMPLTAGRRLYDRVITVLKNIKGDNVSYTPMYPNFPKQVMEASEFELLFNALVHYWSGGALRPSYSKEVREVVPEDIDYTTITLASEEDYLNILPTILSSADSISEEDKNIVEAMVTGEPDARVPQAIPFAENRIFVGSLLFQRGYYNTDYIQTTTDVLRLATALSDGDISLAENTRFRNFKRPERRALVQALERVFNAEDLVRHRGKWIRLLHSLHVGDYSKDLWNKVKALRNNERIETFNSNVENALFNGWAAEAATFLVQRPGEFARRILNVIDKTPTVKRKLLIVQSFADVVDQVPTRNLLQLYGMVLARANGDLDLRVAFPKGQVQRALAIRDHREQLPTPVANDLSSAIVQTLAERFAKLPKLGKVWIDPALLNAPLPTQQRSASVGEWSVARGTHLALPADGKDFLRFFIYWVGRDIDLSCSFHDEEFKLVRHVSYTNLRDFELETWHSGDIVSAPNGASEFIDVNMTKAAQKARYVAMNVYVFNGPTFADHETVYAGWMTRSRPNSHEVYDPATVAQKVDVTVNSKNAIPVIFDLKTRTAIWTDISTSSRHYWGGNNVESNRATTEEVLESVVNTTKTRVSLGMLFDLHARTRGQLVATREEADVTFGFERGVDITPYDINEINANFVVD